jgi:hypothetical protein
MIGLALTRHIHEVVAEGANSRVDISLAPQMKR